MDERKSRLVMGCVTVSITDAKLDNSGYLQPGIGEVRLLRNDLSDVIASESGTPKLKDFVPPADTKALQIVYNHTAQTYVTGVYIPVYQDIYGTYWTPDSTPDYEGWIEEELSVATHNSGDDVRVKIARGQTFLGSDTLQAWASLMNVGSTISVGTPVLCRWFPRLNKWLIIEAACAPDPDYVTSVTDTTGNDNTGGAN